MNRTFRIYSCRAILVLQVFIAVLLGSGRSFAAAPTPVSDSVRLQLKWRYGFQFAGYIAAVEKGFYRDAGLNVQLVEGAVGMSYVDEVVSGRSEFGVSGPVCLLDRSRGAPVVALASIFQHSSTVLITRESDHLHSPQDLIGRKLLVRRGIEASVSGMFRHEGISVDDLTLVSKTGAMDDLIEGRVDAVSAYSTDEPYRMRELGVEPYLIRPQEYGVDFYGDCLITSDNEIRKRPRNVAAFREASLRGWDYAMEHPEEICALIYEKYSNLRSLDALRYEAEVMQTLVLPEMVEVGHMSRRKWEQVLEHYAELGLVEEEVVLDDFIYTPPAEHMSHRMHLLLVIIGVLAVAGLSLWLINRKMKRVIAARTQDITLAAEKLAASEERYRLIVEGQTDFVVKVDAQGRFQFMSPSFYTLLNDREEVLLGKSFFDKVSDEDAPRFRAQWTSLFSPPYSEYIEQHISTDSGEHWLGWQVTAVLDDAGQVAEILAVGRDITDSKLAAAKLAVSEERYRLIVEGQTDLVAKVDVEGRFLFASPSYCTMFGITEEEIIGQLFYNMISEQHLPEMRTRWNTLFEPPYSLYYERIADLSTGTHWLGWKVTSVFDDAGEVVAVLAVGRDITESKLAAEKLRASEERMELALTGADLGTWDWDILGDKVTYNARWGEMIGYELGELTSKELAWVNRIHPDDKERSNEALRAHFAGEVPLYECEMRMRHKDGHWVWVLGRGKVVERLEDGTPVRACGTRLDITERKRVAEKLKDSEERMNMAIGGAELGTWDWDAVSNRVVRNARWCEMIGGFDNELSAEGLDWERRVHPDDLERARAEFTAHLNGETEAFNCEMRMRHHDGHWIWVLGCGKVMERNAEGAALRVCGTHMDITDRKLASEKLKASEERMELALGGADLGTWDWDLQTDEVTHNARWLEIVGCEEGELSSRQLAWNDRIHPDDLEHSRAVLRAHLRGETESFECEMRLRHKAGHWVWVLGRGKVMERAEDGTPLRVCGTRLDITERKIASEKLKQSDERMELALEGADLGTWDWDIVSDVVTYNHRWGEILGYEQGELNTSELAWNVRLHPDDVERTRAALHAHMAGETFRYECEMRMRHHDGHWIWVLDRGKVVERNEAGEAIRFCGTHLDITERKRIDEAMQSLIHAGASGTGGEFFKHIVRDLSRILQADYVMVVERSSSDEKAFFTHAICKNGEIIENLTFGVDGTPCEQVMAGHIEAFQQGVSTHFKEAAKCQEWGVEGYVGVPLISTGGERQGALAALYCDPVKDVEFATNILQVFSGVVGTEIERVRAKVKIEQISRFPAESPHLVMRFEASGQIQYANETSMDLLNSWQTTAGKFVPSYIQEFIESAILSQKSSVHEIDLGERILALNFVPILSEGYVNVYGRDVSGLKRAERESERLTLAIEQAAEIVVLTDPMAIIQYVNPAFEVITGYSREEVVGKNARILQSGNTHKDYYVEMWSVLTSGKTWTGRLENSKKDGTVYIEDASISPVHDAEGNVIHYVATKQDVTHEIELEAQLRQSQKMEAVGQMAGGVAHDFNNLLQVIHGYAELLDLDLPQNPGFRQSLEEIVTAAQRGKMMVHRLLAFSRRQVIRPHDIRINEVIESLANLIHGLVGDGVAIEVDLDPEAQDVRADRSMIEQVLVNLCVNARDAMPDGGTIMLKTQNYRPDAAFLDAHAWAKDGDYLRVTVADNGSGIDEVLMSRIFEPFFTTKDVGQGSGLGLSMAYGIMKQHSGHIMAESTLGEGTRFSIYLPAVSTHLPAAPRDAILFIASDPSLAAWGVAALKEGDYAVTLVRDRRAALAYLDAHVEETDLVVSDLLMNPKDLRNCPYLLVSDSPEPEEALARKTRGYAMYAPVDSKRLIKFVRMIFKKEFIGSRQD